MKRVAYRVRVQVSVVLLEEVEDYVEAKVYDLRADIWTHGNLG